MASLSCALCERGTKAREAACRQLAALAAENEALQEEVDRLREQLRGMEVLPGDHDELLAGDLHCAPPSETVTLHEDVLTEGDWQFPRRLDQSWKPKDGVNVTAMAVQQFCSQYITVLAFANKTVQVYALDAGTHGVHSLVVERACPAPAIALDVVMDTEAACLRICAGHMDGNVSVWTLAPTGAGDTDGLVMDLQLDSYMELHRKYVSHCRWSHCGQYIATGSSDRSVCLLAKRAPLLCVPGEGTYAGSGGASFVKIQQLYFLGPVTALSWHASTVVVAIGGMPVLYYLTLVSLSSTTTSVDATSAVLLPTPTLTGEDEAGALRLPSLLCHRVPLSEDSCLVDINARASERSSHTATARVSLPQGATLPQTGEPERGAVEDTVDDTAPTPHRDLTEGGFLIPVGFTIVDMATSIDEAGGLPRLAVAADNGVVYVFEWGTNTLLHRLAGHHFTSGLQCSTRLSWCPESYQYLAVTSERDWSVCVYSAVSGRILARLGAGQAIAAPLSCHPRALTHATSAVCDTAGNANKAPVLHSDGHTGLIKQLMWAAPHLMVTAGFDKRVLVWV